MEPEIRDAGAEDAAVVADIYNHYIAGSIATFETELITAGDMARRLRVAEMEGLPWLVAQRNATCLGYAYASNWSARPAYRFSVETTVYVAAGETGQGIGRTLYSALLQRLREIGKHTAIARIALPNPASVAVHEQLGFRQAGHFADVGYKFDRWIDVGYWQLILQAGET